MHDRVFILSGKATRSIDRRLGQSYPCSLELLSTGTLPLEVSITKIPAKLKKSSAQSIHGKDASSANLESHSWKSRPRGPWCDKCATMAAPFSRRSNKRYRLHWG